MVFLGENVQLALMVSPRISTASSVRHLPQNLGHIHPRALFDHHNHPKQSAYGRGPSLTLGIVAYLVCQIFSE